MKLAVRSMFLGGIEVAGDPSSGPTSRHLVVDEQSGWEFASFDSKIEAESWLAAMRSQLESVPMPPMSQAELRLLEQKLSACEDEEAERLKQYLPLLFALDMEARIGDERLRQRFAALRKRAAGA